MKFNVFPVKQGSVKGLRIKDFYKSANSIVGFICFTLFTDYAEMSFVEAFYNLGFKYVSLK